MTAFDKAWGIVKNDSNEDKEWRRMQDQLANHGLHEDEWLPKWDGFDPEHDTCTGCGGQMTPHWPGYGPDGPDNGNCDSELPECDVRYMLDMQDKAKPSLFFPNTDYESLIEMIHDERRRGNHDFPNEYDPLRNYHEGLAESRSESYANRD